MAWDSMRKFLARENTWSSDQYHTGELVLTNTCWDDMRVSLNAGRLPASNYPAWAQIADDGAASTGIFGYSFDDGEYIFITTQMSHRYVLNSAIHPHIHYHVTTNSDPADNFGIGLEFAWVDINGTLGNTTVYEREISTGVNQANIHKLAEIPTTSVTGSGAGVSSLFIARLYRYAATSDNYADPIIIMSFDLHYEVDMLGSRLEYSK